MNQPLPARAVTAVASVAEQSTTTPAGSVPASVSIAIAGSGGTGAMTTGTMLLDAAGQAGWYGYMTRSSGAQIRGGEVAAMIRLSTEPVDSHSDHFDVVLAIDWRNVDRFASELTLSDTSLLIGDPDSGDVPPALQTKQPRQRAVPLGATAQSVQGGRPNMVALGLVAGLIGLPNDALQKVLVRDLGKKGDAAVRSSASAIEKGFALAATLPAVPRLPAAVARGDLWSITGNEASGLGAIAAGVRFVSAYPITPGTEILEWLAPALASTGGVLVQAEDELASINQIIGASYGGVPALTATAGPGLSLMIESIGLAVAAEVPIVIVDVMRGGPSTGIPVKSEQSDLNIAVYGMHGDAPHVVVAPVSVGDCLFTTQWGVHLAEAMQTPCIVLSDQSLGQTRAVIPKPADVSFIAQRLTARPVEGGKYQRYAITESGISPMSLPGMPGGQYTADGLEHNPFGTPSSESTNHAAQMDKRQRKIELFNYGMHWADVSGEGEVAILTWGSSTGPSREAVRRLKARGVNARLIAIRLLAPAQPQRLAEELQGVKRVLVVEQSHGRQFYRMLRAFYDLPDNHSFAQPGPLPIPPGAIVDALLNWK